MPTLQKVTQFVSKHLTLLIFAVMLLGLLNTAVFGGIPFNLGVCAAASFLMIYPMFINLKVGDVVEVKNFKGPVALSVVLNFIVSPLLAWGLGRLFLADQPWLALGLMLISLLPTSGMTATWTELSKGNLKVALSIIAVSLLIIIIGLPLALPVVAGGLLDASPFFIFQRILLVIVVPLTLGDLTRRWLIKKKGLEGYKKQKPLFSALSSMGLLVVLFLIMSLDTNTLLLTRPSLVLVALVPLLAYYLSMFALSTLSSRGFPKPVSTAVVYGTSVRYLALALGIAVPLLGSNGNSALVVFVVALAFFVQVPMSSAYAKWLASRASPTPPTTAVHA